MYDIFKTFLELMINSRMHPNNIFHCNVLSIKLYFFIKLYYFLNLYAIFIELSSKKYNFYATENKILPILNDEISKHTSRQFL